MSLSSALNSQRAIAALALPLRERLERLAAEPAIRRSLPALAVAAVAGLGLGGWLMLRAPEMMPLYPGMADADKSRVVTMLTGAGIPADLQPTTGEVQVPAADYQKARMLLAAQGLPVVAPDAEVMLDKLQLGSSSAVEALRLKQAQEAELSRSIAMIAGVESARVHLALPERSAFVRDTLPPTASVVLSLRPGFRLAASQAEAIINLVSSSVPGLAGEHVSVIDQRGQLLSDGPADALDRLTDRQSQQRARLEELYRNRILALLSPLTGPENLSVQVNLDMDFSVTEVQDQQIIPDSATVLSEESQSATTDQPTARGIPGGVSNTPPAAAATTGAKPEAQGPASTAQSQSASSKRTYDVGRRVQTTRPGAPRVVKVNAAVLVGAVAGQDAQAIALRLADMERLVKGAVGFDPARGDMVTVLAQPFIQTAADGTAVLPEQAAAPGLLADWRILAALGLAATALVGGGGFLLLRRGRAPVPALPTAAPGVAGVAGLRPAGILVPDAAEAGPSEEQLRLDRRVQLARSAMSAGNRDEKFAILRQIATEDPARVAAVLRKMMKDEIDRVM